MLLTFVFTVFLDYFCNNINARDALILFVRARFFRGDTIISQKAR